MALLEVRDLKKHYELKTLFGAKGTVKALDGLSFSLNAGETLAIVGESGCGKTTLAKCLMGIEAPTAGELRWSSQSKAAQRIQMIFQDPYSSINPRKKAWQIVAEPLVIRGELPRAQCKERALQLLERVGLRAEHGDRYPHMFSGGQRQRIGIARALSVNPEILICDEPVSALDVSIQSQILNVLAELQKDLGLSYIFISHDLSVVRHIADRVMVIYLGKVVEAGTKNEIFENPQHPYTKALIASTPSVDFATSRERIVLKGELPSPIRPPSGCTFHKRCPVARETCKSEVPLLRNFGDRQASCHLL